MRTRQQILAVLITLLLLGSIFSLAIAQSTQPAQSAQPAENQDPGFEYQGNQKLNGQLTTDTCNFQFSLYDAVENGFKNGDAQEVPGAMVTGGRFSTTVNTGDQLSPWAFSGKAHWLKIAVRCPTGSGDYITLSPRQPLAVVPYALRLKPGAEIRGTVWRTALTVVNENRNSVGIQGPGLGVGRIGIDGYSIGVQGAPQ